MDSIVLPGMKRKRSWDKVKLNQGAKRKFKKIRLSIADSPAKVCRDAMLIQEMAKLNERTQLTEINVSAGNAISEWKRKRKRGDSHVECKQSFQRLNTKVQRGDIWSRFEGNSISNDLPKFQSAIYAQKQKYIVDALPIRNQKGLLDCTLCSREAITSISQLACRSNVERLNCSPVDTPRFIGAFQIGRHIGKGSCGSVSDCFDEKNNTEYAVKVISMDRTKNRTNSDSILREVSMLKNLQHKNIIKFVGALYSLTEAYIITEVASTDLFDYLDAHSDGMNLNDVREVIFGIGCGLQYIHSKNICHRDVKPENILLARSSGHYATSSLSREFVRICDFGSCAENMELGLSLSDSVGSAGFFAPELIVGKPKLYDGLAADMWSLGCIMLEMLDADEFRRLWLPSYDKSLIRNPSDFERVITRTVQLFAYKCDISPCHKARSFACEKFLKIDASIRITSNDLINDYGYDKTWDAK